MQVAPNAIKQIQKFIHTDGITGVQFDDDKVVASAVGIIKVSYSPIWKKKVKMTLLPRYGIEKQKHCERPYGDVPRFKISFTLDLKSSFLIKIHFFVCSVSFNFVFIIYLVFTWQLVTDIETGKHKKSYLYLINQVKKSGEGEYMWTVRMNHRYVVASIFSVKKENKICVSFFLLFILIILTTGYIWEKETGYIVKVITTTSLAALLDLGETTLLCGLGDGTILIIEVDIFSFSFFLSFFLFFCWKNTSLPLCYLRLKD